MKLISLLYNKINWANKPSTNTPINAMNLGKMDKGIDDITKALTDNGVSFNFGYNGTDYGYYKNGESTLTPFRLRHTGTYKPTSRASNNDMGLYHTNRYVDTTEVPNSNSETYPVTSNGTKDMGATNKYRYLNVAINQIPSFTLLSNDVPSTSSFTKSLPAGYSRYIVIVGGIDNTPSVSGCGATLITNIGTYRYGGRVYVCTTSGTITVSTDTSGTSWGIGNCYIIGVKC